jgi:hypothetical protein
MRWENQGEPVPEHSVWRANQGLPPS